MKKWKETWRPYMLRPLVYMTFTRFLLALAAALLIDFFLRDAAGRDLRQTACLLMCLLFALLAVVAWLRLDGLKLPKFMMLRINPRKKPARMYGDMSDFVDDKPVAFEELEDAEKDACILGADAICCGLFLIISFFL